MSSCSRWHDQCSGPVQSQSIKDQIPTVGLFWKLKKAASWEYPFIFPALWVRSGFNCGINHWLLFNPIWLYKWFLFHVLHYDLKLDWNVCRPIIIMLNVIITFSALTSFMLKVSIKTYSLKSSFCFCSTYYLFLLHINKHILDNLVLSRSKVNVSLLNLIMYEINLYPLACPVTSLMTQIRL